MRRLVYNGVLSEDTAHWILSSNYLFWLEITENFPWPEFSRWVESFWPKDRPVIIEDCMGGTQTRMDNNGYTTDRRFIGLMTELEMELVAHRWPAYIKVRNPFKTEFSS